MKTAATLLVAALLGTDLFIYKGPPELRASAARAKAAPLSLNDFGSLPELAGATGWLNSMPLTLADLRGKVVVLDVWTFACSNCLAALPHVKALHEKYAAQGTVVIGVHTPELTIEFSNALGTRYWPSLYIVDKAGRIRYHHDGEGDYEQQDRVVRQLLADSAR